MTVYMDERLYCETCKAVTLHSTSSEPPYDVVDAQCIAHHGKRWVSGIATERVVDGTSYWIMP